MYTVPPDKLASHKAEFDRMEAMAIIQCSASPLDHPSCYTWYKVMLQLIPSTKGYIGSLDLEMHCISPLTGATVDHIPTLGLHCTCTVAGHPTPPFYSVSPAIQ